MSEILNYVTSERAKADSNDDASLRDKARLVADFYDIICLSKFVGFNQNYLLEAAKEWDSTNKHEEWAFLSDKFSLPLDNKLVAVQVSEAFIDGEETLANILANEPATEVIPIEDLPDYKK